MSSDKYLDYKRIVKIIVGNLLITSAYAFITVPNEIVNGGVTSFSMILSNMTDVNITIYTNTITVILLLLCGLFLGKQFFSGSIFSCIAYMIFFTLLRKTGIEIHTNPIISALFGGVIVGTGYYMCLSAESTAIGFDVLALILKRKFEWMDVAVTMGIINVTVLLIGLISFGIISVICGIFFTVVQSFTLKLALKYRGGLSVNENK